MALFGSGHFGNKMRQWPSLDDCIKDGFSGTVGVRSRKPSSPFCKIGMTVDQAREWIERCLARGGEPWEFYLGEDIPVEWRTLQGEVYRGPGGLYLNYSTLQLHVRPALAQGGRHCHGLEAKLRLQHYMDPSSYDWLMELLDTYPDAKHRGYETSHVVEFTTCDRPVGDTPGMNTIFWECRAC